MGGCHRSAPRRQRGTDDPGWIEVVNRRTDTHHIHKGIDGSNLMEVNGLHRSSMHGGFGFRQTGEHGEHPLLQRWRQSSCIDLITDPRPMAVGRLILKTLHINADASETGTARLLLGEAITPRQTEGRQRRLHHGLVHTQIQQCGQEHVPCQPCWCINPKRAHRPRRGAASNRTTACWSSTSRC